MPVEHLMPVPPEPNLTLDSMSSAECIQLLRDIVVALALRNPGSDVTLSGSELVRAHDTVFKMTLRPTEDGTFVEDIRISLK